MNVEGSFEVIKRAYEIKMEERVRESGGLYILEQILKSLFYLACKKNVKLDK